MAGDRRAPFGGVYENQKVLVTGHTGFKGSWLALWLAELGAEVSGYSLEPPTDPSHFEAIGLPERMRHHLGDVRDYDALEDHIQRHRPRVIFHLAAQALVRRSYREPRETFDTNVGGTVNVLEAARTVGSVKSLVIVTSDKCYEERGGKRGYSEGDRLGGSDPYSASKGMAELAVASYLRSFFGSGTGKGAPGRPALGLASARAGNVIGGGDFGEDRLVPDCIRALAAGRPVGLRNPNAIRPWQYVLEPLSGYLLLGARLLEAGGAFSGGWNFGPFRTRDVSAARLTDKIIQAWGGGGWRSAPGADACRETESLRLACGKAARLLSWRSVYPLERALDETVLWYKTFYGMGKSGSMRGCSFDRIRAYVESAQRKKLEWACR